MKKGTCSICGEERDLTREHTPPRKAFNDSDVFLKKVDMEGLRTKIKWKSEKRQGGFSEYVLCQPCNNDTGNRYAAEYVRFTKECAQYARPDLVNRYVCVNISGIKLLSVAKQALVMLSCSSGKDLTEKYPEIRKLILDKYEKGLPEYLRLFTFLRSHEGMRATGMTGIYNVYTGNMKVVSEFSSWPVGFILSFFDNSVFFATEITHWFKYSFNERKTSSIELPCLSTDTFFPLDFRTRQEVLRDRENSLKQMYTNKTSGR